MARFSLFFQILYSVKLLSSFITALEVLAFGPGNMLIFINIIPPPHAESVVLSLSDEVNKCNWAKKSETAPNKLYKENVL